MNRILNLSESEDWERYLSLLNIQDVYFLPEYLRVNQLVSDGQAECFVFVDESGVALYPYIKRRIPNSDLCDITSAYGFGGYLMNSDKSLSENFDKAFSDHCRKVGIVSEFIRFHPLFENHKFSSDDSLHIENHHQTVSASFPNGISDVDGMINKEVRKKIRKAEKNGIEVVSDAEGKHYEEFMAIYNRTMNYKNAADFYFFDSEYFHQMRERLRDHLTLLVALYQGRVVGGLLLFHSGEHTYNHLSGSDYDHRNLGVNDILQYKAMQWAALRGCKKYLLGGGMSGEDSLFHFKAKFSPQRQSFFIGKRIHLPDAYNELCRNKIRQEKSHAIEFLSRDWFPLYRSEPKISEPFSTPALIQQGRLAHPAIRSNSEKFGVAFNRIDKHG